MHLIKVSGTIMPSFFVHDYAVNIVSFVFKLNLLQEKVGSISRIVWSIYWRKSPRKLKKGNLLFTPFCHHTWRGVTVSPNFVASGLGKRFLFACIACFVWTYIAHSIILLPGKYITMARYAVCRKTLRRYSTPSPSATSQNGGHYYTVTQWSKRDQIPLLTFLVVRNRLL